MSKIEKYLGEAQNDSQRLKDKNYGDASHELKKEFVKFSKAYMKILEKLLFNRPSNKKLMKNRDVIVDAYIDFSNAIDNHLKTLSNEPNIYKRR
jgi:hypothetical protein